MGGFNGMAGFTPSNSALVEGLGPDDMIELQACLLRPDLPGDHARYVDGRARAIDRSRSGTPRPLEPGRCFDFDGAADSVDIGAAPLFPATGDFTFSCWVRRNSSSGNDSIIGQYIASSGNGRVLVRWAGSIPEIFLGNEGSHATVSVTGSALPLNTWANLVCVRSGADFTVYVDGTSGTTHTDADATRSILQTGVVVGAQSSTGAYNENLTDFMDGQLFDVRLFSRALTAQEIARIAAMRPGIADIGPTDPVLWLKCNEISGVTARDSSGSRNDGVISAAALGTFFNESANDQYSFENEEGYHEEEYLAQTQTKRSFGSETTDEENISNLAPSGTSYTLEGFFESTQTAGSYVLDYASPRRVFAWVASGFVSQLGFFDGVTWHTAGASSTPNDGNEHHVAWVVDGTSCKFFVDGVQVGSTATVVSGTPGGSALLGATAGAPGSAFYTGDMRKLRLWDRALSDDEVSRASAGNEISEEGAIRRNFPIDHNPKKPAGKFGGADRASIDGSTLPTEAATISAWVKLNANGNFPTILSTATNASSNNGMALISGNGSNRVPLFYANTYASNRASAAAALDIGRWYHLCGTWDGTTVRIYVDGVLQASTGTFSGTISHEAVSYIGATADTSYQMEGDVSNIQVYDRAVTDAEAATLAGTMDAVLSDPVNRWAIDEGENKTLIDSIAANNGALVADSGLSRFWDGRTDIDDTLTNVDVLRNALTYTGQAPRDAIVSVPCWTGDGVGDHAEGENTTELNFERTDDFSVAFWVKYTSTANTSYVGQMEGSPGFSGWEIFSNAGAPQFQLISANGSNEIKVKADGPINDGSWHHVVVTYDGSSSASGVSVYVDGVAVSTSTSSDTLSSSTAGTGLLTIAGRNGGTPFFPGQLSDVRVYSAKKTSLQATALYNGTNDTDDLVGHWPLSEGGGKFNADISGNDNHGVITGTESAIWANTIDRGYAPIAQLNDGVARATRYSGSGEYYEGATSLGDAFGETSFSTALWFRHGNPNNDGLLSFGPFTTSGEIDILAINTSEVIVRLNAIGYSKTVSISDGDWNHLAVVHDGSTVTIYINGVEYSSEAYVAALDFTGYKLVIGAYFTSATPYDGMLSGVVLEAAAWDAETVTQVMAGTIPAGAYYFPYGDGQETQQGLADLTKNGTPDPVSIPVRTVTVPRQATHYDGTGDYFSGKSPYGKTSELSVACWFNSDAPATNNGGLVSFGSFAGAHGEADLLFNGTGADELAFRVDSNGAEANHSITDSGWHHVVGTYDGTTIRLYVDGVEVDSTAYSTVLDLEGVTMALGAYFSSSFEHHGKLSKIAIEDRLWTEEEIAALYAETAVPSTALYFPDGDGRETQQGTQIGLTVAGNPVPLPNDLPKNINGGILLDSTHATPSLDLSGGEANSPYAQQIAAGHGDTTYDVGDDDGASNYLYARDLTDETGDDRVYTFYPALSGQDDTDVVAYTT